MRAKQVKEEFNVNKKDKKNICMSKGIKTLSILYSRTGDANLRFYITTAQDG